MSRTRIFGQLLLASIFVFIGSGRAAPVRLGWSRGGSNRAGACRTLHEELQRQDAQRMPPCTSGHADGRSPSKHGGLVRGIQGPPAASLVRRQKSRRVRHPSFGFATLSAGSRLGPTAKPDAPSRRRTGRKQGPDRPASNATPESPSLQSCTNRCCRLNPSPAPGRSAAQAG